MTVEVDAFDIEPKLVTAIGMLAIQWARVEYTLQRTALSLLGAPATNGFILTTNLGFKTLSEFILACTSAPPLEGTELADDLATLMSEAQRIIGIRNGLVHNTWPTPRGAVNFTSLVIRFKGKIRLREEAWTENQIGKLIEETVELLEALTELLLKHKIFISLPSRDDSLPSQERFPSPLPAQPPARNPKTEEVVSRLLSSQA